MKKIFSAISILVMITIPVTGLAANLLPTGPGSFSPAPGQAPAPEADRESLWQRLQQWEEEKEPYTVQQPSPFDQLRQDTGRDFISDEDIEQRIKTIANELATLNKQLAPAAHYSQVPLYHSIIMLLSRIDMSDPLVWKMLTVFLAGDDETMYRLPYDKKAFHTALDYLQAVLRARILQEQDSAATESLQKLLSIVEPLRNDPEGIVTLHLEQDSAFKPLIAPYLEDPYKNISAELHSFLAAYLGNDLYSSLFPGQEGIATPEKWLSLRQRIISLDSEYRQLLFHLIEQAAEQGNTLIADSFSPSPYVDFPGTCAQDADFTFTVRFGCWCEADNRWAEETRPLQPLDQSGDRLMMENTRRFLFDNKQVAPASACRPCYGVLHYGMNNYCDTDNLEGSLFWGAVTQ
jgi:hypothetical protein